MAEPNFDFDDIDDRIELQTIIDEIIDTKGRDWYNRVVESYDVDPSDTERIVKVLYRALDEERRERTKADTITSEEHYAGVVSPGEFIEYEISYRMAGSYNRPRSTRTPRIVIDATFIFAQKGEDIDRPDVLFLDRMQREMKNVAEQYYRTDFDKPGAEGVWDWEYDEGLGKPQPTGAVFKQHRWPKLAEASIRWETKYAEMTKPAKETITVNDRGAFVRKYGQRRSNRILPVSERGEKSVRTGEPI